METQKKKKMGRGKWWESFMPGFADTTFCDPEQI
jgi:hypothetical protein